MTKQEIEAVFERAQTWQEEQREEAAKQLLIIERFGVSLYPLTEEELAALDEAEAEGDASSEEVEAVFSRYRA